MRRCGVQGRLPGFALTVAARLVRTVTPSQLHSEWAVQFRLVGKGLCGTVGLVSPDKDELHLEDTEALSLVYVAWFEGSCTWTGTRTPSMRR